MGVTVVLSVGEVTMRYGISGNALELVRHGEN